MRVVPSHYELRTCAASHTSTNMHLITNFTKAKKTFGSMVVKFNKRDVRVVRLFIVIETSQFLYKSNKCWKDVA